MRPEVLIGVPCGEVARSNEFWGSILGLQVPDKNVHLYKSVSKSPSMNRNEIIRQAQAIGAKKIFFADDDHVLPRDTIMRLHKHDVDVVSALYPMGWYPFQPAAFKEQDEKGKVTPFVLSKDDKGLQEVKAVGAGGLLIKTSVFDHPGWMGEFSDRDGSNLCAWWTLGQIAQDNWCDDTHFCLKLRKLGFKVHVDFDCLIQHPPQGLRMNYGKMPDGEWVLKFSNSQGELWAIPLWKPPSK